MIEEIKDFYFQLKEAKSQRKYAIIETKTGRAKALTNPIFDLKRYQITEWLPVGYRKDESTILFNFVVSPVYTKSILEISKNNIKSISYFDDLESAELYLECA